MTRLLVEGRAHERVCMVTLTYDAASCPEDRSLRPSDVSGARKRLRINFERAMARDPSFSDLSEDARKALSRLRFFTVGEYGGRFGRPHYHLIVFGADGSTVVDGRSFLHFVHAAWSRGGVHIGGGWSGETAAYVSGYVVKGHNVKGHGALRGRHPEFSGWPGGRRGGLGVPGLAVLFPEVGREAALADALPLRVDCGSGERWLGRFLLDRLRLQAGLCWSEVRRLKRRLSRVRFLERSISAAESVGNRVLWSALGVLLERACAS